MLVSVNQLLSGMHWIEDNEEKRDCEIPFTLQYSLFAEFKPTLASFYRVSAQRGKQLTSALCHCGRCQLPLAAVVAPIIAAVVVVVVVVAVAFTVAVATATLCMHFICICAARCCMLRRCQLPVCDLRDVASHTHIHRQFDSCMPTLYGLLACTCCCCRCCCSTHRFKSAKLLAVFQLIQLALPAKQAKALKAVANCKGNECLLQFLF